MLHSLIMSRTADHAVAWLLTYALHSTLLLTAAWGVSRWLGWRSLRLQETLWRCALVGGLLTASAQLAFGHLGHAPLAGSWTLAAVAPRAEVVELAAAGRKNGATPQEVQASGTSAFAALGSSAARRLAPEPRGASAERRASAGAPIAPPAAAMGAKAQPGAWTMARLLLPAWGVGSLLLVLACLRAYLALRRQLRYRPQVVGGGVLARLGGLVRGSGISRSVRLTCTWRLRVPVALAGRGAEVCVPPRALFELSDPQQDALLAHELAHLVRRDPLWLPVTHLLVAAFFFQPLNWLARRRLRELSELLCDEWAVAQTGQPLSLAGCLAEVASWSMAGLAPQHRASRIAHLPVPGMAGRPSQLAHRIRRLLDGNPAAGHAPDRRGVAALMAATLMAVALAAPGISAASSPAALPGLAVVAPPGISAASSPAALPTAPASGVVPSGLAVAPSGLAVAPSCAVRAPMAVATLALAGEQRPAGAPASETVPAQEPAPAPEAEAVADATPAPRAVAEEAPVAMAAESERLSAAAARLAQLDRQSALSKEQIAAMTAAVERISHDIDQRVRAQMEDLDRRLASSRAASTPAAVLPPVEELAALGTELAGIAAELHPSREEMAQLESELRKLAANPPHLPAEEMKRMHEEMARELAKLPEAGLSKAEIERLRAEVQRALEESAAAMRHGLPPAERARIIADAHRLAEQARPDRAELDALRDLRRQHEDLSRVLAEQRVEIEAMRREIRIQADALRDQARRLSDSRHAAPRVRPEPRPAAPIPPAAPAAPKAPTPHPEADGAPPPPPPALPPPSGH